MHSVLKTSRASDAAKLLKNTLITNHMLIEAGHIHLCRVAGFTVWSHMSGDTTWLWVGGVA